MRVQALRVNTAAASVALLCLVGCGGAAGPKSAPGKSADAFGATNARCLSTSDCPEVQLIVEASGASGTALQAFINQRNIWAFSATTETAGQREILLYAMYEPAGSQISGQGSTSVEISWTPDQIAQGTKPIEVLARDVTRCKMFEKNSKNCSNMNKKMSKYEKKTQFTYSVVEGATSDGIDPAFIAQQPQAQGANGGLAGCFGGAIPGLMSGLFSGGGGGLMNAGMGCVGGMLGGLGSTGGSTQPLGGLLGGGTTSPTTTTTPTSSGSLFP